MDSATLRICRADPRDDLVDIIYLSLAGLVVLVSWATYHLLDRSRLHSIWYFIMAVSTLFVMFAALLLLVACPFTGAQDYPAPLASTASVTGFRPIFTVPASADVGANLIPNVEDPEAVDAQTVCPGYTASNVVTSGAGFTADLDLAGSACNVYGTDVESLSLAVEYQASDRLHVEILPRYLGPENETWFVLPEAIIPKPSVSGENSGSDSNDFELSWTNDPTFSFTVKRKTTGDTLFTTEGSKLVYENQFVEFVVPLPENYNLYGLGEVFRGFRLGNNLTSKPIPG